MKILIDELRGAGKGDGPSPFAAPPTPCRAAEKIIRHGDGPSSLAREPRP
jgi:hypothetical protein